MSIEEKLAKLPHTITTLGNTGELNITNSSPHQEGDTIDYTGYWSIGYLDKNGCPIESRYDKNSNVYLISFCCGFENAVDDMIDRLEKGDLI